MNLEEYQRICGSLGYEPLCKEYPDEIIYRVPVPFSCYVMRRANNRFYTVMDADIYRWSRIPNRQEILLEREAVKCVARFVAEMETS